MEASSYLLQSIGIIFSFILLSSLSWFIIVCRRWLATNNKAAYQIEDDILDLLPQTQCAQCGHPGCAPYAKSIAAGEAHNKCPPGGQMLIDKLSHLLNRPNMSLDESLTESQDFIAVIREEDCIGCAKCGPVCPTDAIVGANNMMHTVIVQDCTGCELCLPPCPVDCIDLIPRQA